MNHLDLPPFPTMGKKGPQVCESVRFYLAIIDDLSSEQVRILSEHIEECEECAAESRLLQHMTRLIANLPESRPSARADEAVLAALQDWPRRTAGADARFYAGQHSAPQSIHAPRRASNSRRRIGALALAALLLLALVISGAFLRGRLLPANNGLAFQLPANLSWAGYVLHYSQTRSDAQGRPYQVEVYQDLGTDQMHIESSMPGEFDVVVVTNQQSMLGKDMMNRVAQTGKGVENWTIDGSLFHLARLRQDLATRHALYLGEESFQGQKVYQIRASNGQVLLLTMRYLPAGVLNAATALGTGVPVYKTFTLISSAQVTDSMWDMRVPPGFQMGELPASS